MKLHKEFLIVYPLTQKVVRDLKIVIETIGELTIEGVAYCDTNYSKIEVEDRYSLDIDTIKFKGTDIKPVADVSGLTEDIYEYCVVRCADLFETNKAA